MQKPVYVYRRSNFDGKVKLIHVFDDVAQLVSQTWDIASKFGYALEDRHSTGLAKWDPDTQRVSSIREDRYAYWYVNWNYCYVAYENDVTLVTPDRLVGLNRQLHPPRRYYWHSWRKRNWRKGGHYRQMRTTQERRWAAAWDDEEFAPKTRAARNFRNLPNAWDDWWRTEDRNWKRYRRTQWKSK